MKIYEYRDAVALGKAAGALAAHHINEAIAKKGAANIILATGTSQFQTIQQLAGEAVDWSKVTMFHLDEYIGLPESAPASFRKYLRARFLDKVPPLRNAVLVNGETEPAAECARLGRLINDAPIDVALVGIGENGHLGFNDPPADFETDVPFIVVELDHACRQQQLSEGWFKTIDEVPGRAITMSIKQIMKSAVIICSVPDLRKAAAVKGTLEGPVTNACPASILQLHNDCHCLLDHSSASLLMRDEITIEKFA